MHRQVFGLFQRAFEKALDLRTGQGETHQIGPGGLDLAEPRQRHGTGGEVGANGRVSHQAEIRPRQIPPCLGEHAAERMLVAVACERLLELGVSSAAR